MQAEPHHRKVSCARGAFDQVFIKCPKCGVRQEITFGPEGYYEADVQGKLHPFFVCMARDHQEKPICFHEEWIWIVNL